jgi:hypothetical protein
VDWAPAPSDDTKKGVVAHPKHSPPSETRRRTTAKGKPEVMDEIICGRRIFTERFEEGVLTPWARRTGRLSSCTKFAASGTCLRNVASAGAMGCIYRQ